MSQRQQRRPILLLLWAASLVYAATAFSFIPASQSTLKSLHKTLQKSYSATDILERVGCRLSRENDPNGSLSSLTLVRLSKYLIAADNEQYQLKERRQSEVHDDTTANPIHSPHDTDLLRKGLQNIMDCFVATDWSPSTTTIDSVVDGIKATAVIARILHRQDLMTEELWLPLFYKLYEKGDSLAPLLQTHQLSGLQWTMDCLRLVATTDDTKKRCQLPPSIQDAYNALQLPYHIRPGFLGSKSVLASFESPYEAVAEFVRQVDFQSDTIKTTSNRLVKERRQTAWQGDSNVAPFAYSGKSMPRTDWSPIVEAIRDDIHQYTSEYYDGCLLNFYPNGESGMRYHIDPDQGSLWGFETAVVSVGATRRFAFRPIIDTGDGGKENSSSSSGNAPHTFVLFNGDVTEMFSNCQELYQHTVKTADTKKEPASRVSLVFKKTLDDMRT